MQRHGQNMKPHLPEGRIVVYVKRGNSICMAMLDKLRHLGIGFETRAIDDFNEWSNGERKAYLALCEKRQGIPLISVGGEPFTYPQFLRRLRERSAGAERDDRPEEMTDTGLGVG